jgi:hypothetical protein
MLSGFPLKVLAWKKGVSAVGIEELHQLAPSADGADGKTASDDLAHGAEVRSHAVDLLRPAAAQVHPGYRSRSVDRGQ